MTAVPLRSLFTPGVYLVMLGVCALSLVCLYVDFLHNSRVASRTGLVLLVLVWLLETGNITAHNCGP